MNKDEEHINRYELMNYYDELESVEHEDYWYNLSDVDPGTQVFIRATEDWGTVVTEPFKASNKEHWVVGVRFSDGFVDYLPEGTSVEIVD